jgi:hypothetical protein
VEESKSIGYLDLSIHRDTHNLQTGFYRKSTQTDTTIHFTSNHLLEHKLAAYNFYINKILPTPIRDQARQQEWDNIRTIAKNNGFPLRIIHNLMNKITKITKDRKYFHKHTTKNMGHSYVTQPGHA